MASSSFQTRVLFGVQIATLRSMVGGWGVKNPKLNLNFLLIFFEINLFPKRMQAPIEQKRLPNCLFRIQFVKVHMQIHHQAGENFDDDDWKRKIIARLSSRDLEWAQFTRINCTWQFEHFIAVYTIQLHGFQNTLKVCTQFECMQVLRQHMCKSKVYKYNTLPRYLGTLCSQKNNFLQSYLLSGAEQLTQLSKLQSGVEQIQIMTWSLFCFVLLMKGISLKGQGLGQVLK